MLLLDDKSSAFKWTPAFEWDGEQPLTWVSKVEGKPGAIVVDVTSYDKAGNVSGGRAKVKATGTGLQVQGWEKPLR